jgi:hypothetical protein
LPLPDVAFAAFAGEIDLLLPLAVAGEIGF